jgi:hypothetical protein
MTTRAGPRWASFATSSIVLVGLGLSGVLGLTLGSAQDLRGEAPPDAGPPDAGAPLRAPGRVETTTTASCT